MPGLAWPGLAPDPRRHPWCPPPAPAPRCLLAALLTSERVKGPARALGPWAADPWPGQLAGGNEQGRAGLPEARGLARMVLGPLRVFGDWCPPSWSPVPVTREHCGCPSVSICPADTCEAWCARMGLGQILGDPLKALRPLPSVPSWSWGSWSFLVRVPGESAAPSPPRDWVSGVCLRPHLWAWRGAAARLHPVAVAGAGAVTRVPPQPQGSRGVASGGREGSPAAGPALWREPPATCGWHPRP